MRVYVCVRVCVCHNSVWLNCINGMWLHEPEWGERGTDALQLPSKFNSGPNIPMKSAIIGAEMNERLEKKASTFAIGQGSSDTKTNVRRTQDAEVRLRPQLHGPLFTACLASPNVNNALEEWHLALSALAKVI